MGNILLVIKDHLPLLMINELIFEYFLLNLQLDLNFEVHFNQ